MSTLAGTRALRRFDLNPALWEPTYNKTIHTVFGRFAVGEQVGNRR
jgi:hypothetical protein